MQIDELTAFTRPLLGAAVSRMEPLSGGKNNRIFTLALTDGREIVAKCYLINPNDPRDRCGTEFAAHHFLWESGVRIISQPLACATTGEVAFYSKLPGNCPRTIDEGAIDQAVEFTANLAELSHLPAALSLPRASEASYSALELIKNIEGRLALLHATAHEQGGTREFRSFVLGDLSDAVKQCKVSLQQSKLTLFVRRELDRMSQMLSPSDFGFHNALRDASGVWRFLDFEYFGWDDPAKLICDFLLHPAMQLSAELRDRFTSGVLKRLSSFEELRERVELEMPCFRAKWSMIMLNEFQRDHRRRREFSTGQQGVSEGALSQQLCRAQHMLAGSEVA